MKAINWEQMHRNSPEPILKIEPHETRTNHKLMLYQRDEFTILLPVFPRLLGLWGTYKTHFQDTEVTKISLWNPINCQAMG